LGRRAKRIAAADSGGFRVNQRRREHQSRRPKNQFGFSHFSLWFLCLNPKLNIG
jgi:hypothetical protein